jgi:thiol-disulfide isomerase/thioredoxin
MYKNPRYSKVLVMLICVAFFSSIFVATISEEIREEKDPFQAEELNENTNIPQATGTRAPAQTTRSVLVELVTGTWCPPCQGGEGALDRLANEYPLTELSILEYHAYNGDPYEVPGNQERASYYGIGSVPTAVFDGIDMVVGGSSNPDDPGTYNSYKTKIDARLPVASPVTVTLTGSLTGGTGSIIANITAIDNIPPGLTNLKARFVVYEDHNYTIYVSGREYRLRYTVVEHLTEESISLSMYDNLQFTKTFSIDPAWDTELLGAVCFIQADSTKEILQATSFNLSAASSKVDLAVTPDDITFSDPTPNENQLVTIYATIHNKGTATTPSDVTVLFYDGDPSAGGTLIGTMQNIGTISSGGSAIAQVTWDTTGAAGDHEIVVVVDDTHTNPEPENENNNIAPKFINVIPGPPPEVDYVQIRDAPGGGGLNLCDLANYPNYPVGHITTFYAAAYNYSFGYLFEVDSAWMTSDDLIVDVTTSGSSSTVTCSSVNDGTATITVLDSVWGKMNTTDVTVLPPTIDYIQIRDAPGGGGAAVASRSYAAFETDTFYAAAYNSTAGYLNDVSADWSSDDPTVGDVSPATGTSTTFTAQQISLDDTCTVTATYGLVSDSTGLLTVLGPAIDFILIRDAAGGAGNVVTTATYGVAITDDFYAAAYNNTVSYVADVGADWSCSLPLVGDVSPLVGTMTTFTAQQVGTDTTCTVTATYGLVSDSTDLLTVLAPVVDEIKIRDAAAGAGVEVNTATYVIGGTDQFYAAAYNGTIGYFMEVACDWASDDPGVGDVSPATGTSTTFTAQDVALDSTCTITATYGLLSDSTGLLTVLASTIDYIRIEDASGSTGTEIVSHTFVVLETMDLYAAAYNDTTGYLGDVNADWLSSDDSIGAVSPLSGITTTFTAQQVASDTTCTVTATYGLLVDSTDIFIVLAPDVDEIRIKNAADDQGDIVTTATYLVWETEDFYAAGYNDTVGYLYEVNAVWSSDATSVGDVFPATGSSTTFTAQKVSADSTCTVTATFGGFSDSTGLLTVLYPRIDFIRIEDAAGGLGSIIDTATYSVLDTDEFYAAAYNITANYLYDVNANWLCDDENIATVTTPGIFTDFTAQQIDSDQTCIITATFNSLTDTTGDLTVLSPRVDFIKIMDGANGLGSEVTTNSYVISETDEFYAAAYNDTVGYFSDVTAEWSCDFALIGDVFPATGTTTTFIAQEVTAESTCTISASYGLLSDSTDLLTVLEATIDEIKIMDAPGGGGNEVTTGTYAVLETDEFYAAAYNATTGYLGDVSALWSSDDALTGDVFQTSGINTTFTAQKILTESTCTVTALYGFFQDSTRLLTVMAPKVDEIRIRNAKDGEGEVVTTGLYGVGDSENFFAAAYNDTVGYLFDVSVTWSTDVPTAADVSPATGTSTTFTAKEISIDTTCKVIATYGALSDSTELLLVLAPTIDEIIICDGADGTGIEITTAIYDAQGTDTFFAAAYNETSGYLYDVLAEWTIDSDSIGTVTPQGTFTTFTAATLEVAGTCTVTSTYQGISGSTGLLNINAYVDTTPPQAPGKPELDEKEVSSIELSWTPNTEPDLDKYLVQRAEDPNGPWKDVATVDSESTSYKDIGLDPGTKYYYRVIAYDEAGNPSVASETIEVETTEPVDFFGEFMWLLIILIIVVVVIIAAALAAKGRKKKAQPPAAAPVAQPTKKPLPPPPKKRTTQKPKTVDKIPVEDTGTSKPLPPPPKSLAQEKKEMPPPPPPPPPEP